MKMSMPIYCFPGENGSNPTMAIAATTAGDQQLQQTTNVTEKEKEKEKEKDKDKETSIASNDNDNDNDIGNGSGKESPYLHEECDLPERPTNHFRAIIRECTTSYSRSKMKRVLRSTPDDSRTSDLKRKKTQATTTVREGRWRSSPFPDDSPSRSLMASHRSTPRTPSGKGKRQQAYHKATWDEDSTQIFLQLVVKEIEAGNRPHMSITPNGYRSLSKTFEAATGRLHSTKQLKNKYNLLKTEWRAWCKLMDCRKGPTGIGFDQETGLFNASADWWAKMEKINSVCCKFRTKSLDHPELMERVFTGAAATGKNAWTPGETRNPMELDEESDSPDFSGDSNDVGASEMAAMMNSAHLNATGSGSKRKHSSGNALQNKRVSGAEALAGSMDELLNSVKTQSKELTVNHVVGGHSVTMGQAVGRLYDIQGLAPEDELLHFGVMLMEVPNNREMVMSIPTDQGIIGWLRAKKRDKDRSGGVTLASLLRNEGVRF